ncbi:hypothetical protein [Flavilitoribacter nigricans]|uniref:NERD domain-containing protein n=1 Tax=Flavilitoribacter nigricans (strain ATCC 23147 / DSM 23189 / NBRC 102662 / NCIMB 1420 / SS-2) TaxID=1122177 RepID=A0A2D0N708_FLAN2|nr:hypothetical protein [Flavilitoribacter nigricans]PHN03909.1 hypothetical protein CRP01_23850 [Flavilitoribacter nigricans DSM 23189 = NBRC 102662]
MTFNESGLEFNFGKGWVVKKYDEHAYFRSLSGMGLKGVDFIAIRDQQELIFIEVKNYRTRYNPEMDRSFDVAAKPAAELAYELKRKSEDTLLAIDAVLQYYRRSWWYRRLRNLWMRWPWLQHNRAFWSRADELANHHLHYVVWLALDFDDPENYEEELLFHLNLMQIEAVDRISIANGKHSPFGDEVRVVVP